MNSEEPKQKPHYHGKFLKNIGYGLASNLLVAVVQFFFIAYLFRSLGEQEYGLVALAQGLVASLNFLQLGNSTAVGKRLNTAYTQGDEKSIRVLFSGACVVSFFTVLLLLLIIAAILTVFWPLLNFPTEFSFAGRMVFGAIAVNTVLVQMSLPINSWLHALHRLDIHHKFNMGVLLLRVAITVVLFELIGASPVTYALVLGGSSMMGYLLKLAWVRHSAPYVSIDLSVVSWKTVRNLMGFSISTAAYHTSRMLYIQAPLLIVQYFGGLSASALYGVANQIGIRASSITSNVATAVTPVAVTLHAAKKTEALRTLQNTVIKAFACFAWLIWLGFFFLGDTFLTAWLKEDLPMLAQAIPFAFAVVAIAVLGQTSSPFLMALEKLRWPLIASLLLSIPMFGIMALACVTFKDANVLIIAWGTIAVFFAINHAIGMWVAVRWVGSNYRQIVQSVLFLPILPALAVAVSLWAYRTYFPVTGWSGVLLGIGIAGIAFIPASLLGAFNQNERRMIVGLLKRKSSRKKAT